MAESQSYDAIHGRRRLNPPPRLGPAACADAPRRPGARRRPRPRARRARCGRGAATARPSRATRRMIARELALPPEVCEAVHLAGLLHDVGKTGVATTILGKPGPLSESEWVEMRAHPRIGAEILGGAGLRDVSEWVLSHHERPDGGGYPRGLYGCGDPARGEDPRGRRLVRGDDERPRATAPRSASEEARRGAAAERRHASSTRRSSRCSSEC